MLVRQGSMRHVTVKQLNRSLHVPQLHDQGSPVTAKWRLRSTGQHWHKPLLTVTDCSLHTQHEQGTLLTAQVPL